MNGDQVPCDFFAICVLFIHTFVLRSSSGVRHDVARSGIPLSSASLLEYLSAQRDALYISLRSYGRPSQVVKLVRPKGDICPL